jgi:hypothetical protein
MVVVGIAEMHDIAICQHDNTAAKEHSAMYHGDLKPADLVAFVRPEQDSRLTCGTAYGHVVVTFGYLENGQARGLSGGGWHEIDAFGDLQVRNQVSSGDPSSSGDGSYGWSTEFRNVFSADLRRVESMGKVLRKVARGLEKERDANGCPVTFGQYAARALRALGIKQAMVLKQGEWPSREDVRHRLQKPGAVVERIDEITRTMRESLTALAA